MATTVEELTIRLTADVSNLKRNLKNAERTTIASSSKMSRAFARFSTRIKTASSRLLTMRSATVLAAGAAGLGLLTKKALDAADSLEDFSTLTGVGIERLQELRFAADFVGTGASALDKGMIRLQKSIGEVAAGGTSEAIDAFNALGISQDIVEKKITTSIQVLDVIIDKYADLGTEAEKTANLGDLLGFRAGPRLALLLNIGREGIEKLAQRAREAGAVMDATLVKQSSDLKDEFTALQAAASTAFETGLLSKFATQMDDIEDETVSIAKGFREIGELVGSIVALLSKFASGVGVIGDVIDQSIVRFGGSLVKATSSAAELRKEMVRIQREITRIQDSSIRQALAAIIPGRQTEEQLRERLKNLRQELALQNLIDSSKKEADKPRVAPSGRQTTKTGQDPTAVAKKEIDDLIKSLEEENRLIKVEGVEREILAANIAIENIAKKENVKLSKEVIAAKQKTAESIIREISAQEKLSDEIGDINDLIDSAKTAQDEYNEEIALAEKLFDKGAISVEKYNMALDASKEKLKEAEEASNDLNDITEELADILASSFGDAIIEAGNLTDVLKSLEKQLLSIITRVGIEEPLAEFFKTGSVGGGGNIISDIGNLFGFGGGGGGGGDATPAFDPAASFQDFAGGGVAGSGPTKLISASVFKNAPSFQGGGIIGLNPNLSSGAVPAILHRGETIRTPEQERQLRSRGDMKFIFNITTPDIDSFRSSEGQIRSRIGQMMAITRRRDM